MEFGHAPLTERKSRPQRHRRHGEMVLGDNRIVSVFSVLLWRNFHFDSHPKPLTPDDEGMSHLRQVSVLLKTFTLTHSTAAGESWRK